MNKKTNSVLFILGATVFNILITVICLLTLSVLYFKFLVPVLPEDVAGWGLPVIFIGSIALSFVIYRAAIKLITKRIDMEKNFDPLFGPRKPPRKKQD